MRRPFASFGLVVLVGIAGSVAGCGGGGVLEAFDRGGDGAGSTGDGDGAGVGAMSAREQGDADEVLRLVNEERASRLIGPVLLDGAAADAAYDHAVDMDERGFFAHDAPAPDASTPDERLAAAGATNRGSGENIAMGYVTPSEVMDGWMASDGHRANILNPSFTRLGVGVRYGAGAVYWVQDFLVR